MTVYKSSNIIQSYHIHISRHIVYQTSTVFLTATCTRRQLWLHDVCRHLVCVEGVASEEYAPTELL